MSKPNGSDPSGTLYIHKTQCKKYHKKRMDVGGVAKNTRRNKWSHEAARCSTLPFFSRIREMRAELPAFRVSYAGLPREGDCLGLYNSGASVCTAIDCSSST